MSKRGQERRSINKGKKHQINHSAAVNRPEEIITQASAMLANKEPQKAAASQQQAKRESEASITESHENKEKTEISAQSAEEQSLSAKHNKQLEITPPARIVELEPSYRTRYVAWIGILCMWLMSIAAIIWRGDALEWLLAATMTLIVITSGLLPIMAAYRLSYARDLSTTILEQGHLLIAVSLTRYFPIPGVWYNVYDRLHNRSSMRGQFIGLRASFTPLFHKRMTLTYSLSQLERGSYEASKAVISVGDWLGLTCIRVERKQQHKLIVLPQLQQPEDDTYVARTTSSTWLKKKREGYSGQPSLSTAEQLHWNRESEDNNNTIDHTDHMDSTAPKLFEAGNRNEQQHGISMTTRPYVEGDNYRRLDTRAAVRGQGLHTRMDEEEQSNTRLCLLLDQCDLPYQDAYRDQLFGSLVSWCLADAVEAGEQQAISILSDNWSFDYYGRQQLSELQHLLAITRSDVSLNMGDRVPFYEMLLPRNGHIVVYSGAWKDAEGWLKLAEAAWMKGSRLELQFVTTNRVMTYAMREQQKILESSGIVIVWRYSTLQNETEIQIQKGSERYAAGA